MFGTRARGDRRAIAALPRTEAPKRPLQLRRWSWTSAGEAPENATVAPLTGAEADLTLPGVPGFAVRLWPRRRATIPDDKADRE